TSAALSPQGSPAGGVPVESLTRPSLLCGRDCILVSVSGTSGSKVLLLSGSQCDSVQQFTVEDAGSSLATNLFWWQRELACCHGNKLLLWPEISYESSWTPSAETAAPKQQSPADVTSDILVSSAARLSDQLYILEPTSRSVLVTSMDCDRNRPASRQLLTLTKSDGSKLSPQTARIRVCEERGLLILIDELSQIVYVCSSEGRLQFSVGPRFSTKPSDAISTGELLAICSPDRGLYLVSLEQPSQWRTTIKKERNKLRRPIRLAWSGSRQLLIVLDEVSTDRFSVSTFQIVKSPTAATLHLQAALRDPVRSLAVPSVLSSSGGFLLSALTEEGPRLLSVADDCSAVSTVADCQLPADGGAVTDMSWAGRQLWLMDSPAVDALPQPSSFVEQLQLAVQRRRTAVAAEMASRSRARDRLRAIVDMELPASLEELLDAEAVLDEALSDESSWAVSCSWDEAAAESAASELLRVMKKLLDASGAESATDSSSQAVSATGASKQAVSATDSLNQAVSATGASKQAVSATDSLNQAVSATGASKQAMSATDSSSQAVSATGASKQSVSATGASKQAASATGASKQAVSVASLSGQLLVLEQPSNVIRFCNSSSPAILIRDLTVTNPDGSAVALQPHRIRVCSKRKLVIVVDKSAGVVAVCRPDGRLEFSVGPKFSKKRLLELPLDAVSTESRLMICCPSNGIFAVYFANISVRTAIPKKIIELMRPVQLEWHSKLKQLVVLDEVDSCQYMVKMFSVGNEAASTIGLILVSQSSVLVKSLATPCVLCSSSSILLSVLS
uniref:RING-type domain-containing protein n=1 Tax=Macrostomum lignano TaxID=282301 RepID=A0A1I8FRI7_9PLAT